VELSISLNIAQALEYLHENSIIHRDLSSNNVLIVGENKVKVSDFGMRTLESVNPNRSMTQCPGNVHYMSPQALCNQPTYTAKLDVFSFGVLLVQIMTRQFPNPTNQHQSIEGRNSICRKIPEKERRSEHLGMIANENPLKEISLQCLEDEVEGRPTSA
jgi:serine/threonine-protein kinase TNNI3K